MTTPRRPGPESTLDDVREQLVQAGLDALLEQGVDVGLDHIKLRDVIERAGVARSTAYRSLADDESPQAVLHRAILRRILLRNTRDANLGLIEQAVTDELERQEGNLESGDPARCTYAMRSLIRIGSEASYFNVAGSTERAILTALHGVAQSTRVNDWRTEALVEGERQLVAMFADLYSSMSAIFGYQLKPSMSLDHFTTAVAAMTEGLAMRDSISPLVRTIPLPTGLNGESEDWTLMGITFESLYIKFFEPSGDDPIADLLHY